MTGVWGDRHGPPSSPVCAPFARHAETLTPPDDAIFIIPAASHRLPDRTIIGATILVRSLATAQTILARNHIATQQIPGCASLNLWISPTDAHHLWLELRDQP
jgi:hypothetical protein